MLPASPVAMYCLPCAAGRSTKKDEPKPADPESPWSSTWEEARGKFRDAAAARGAMLEVLRYTERDGFETVWSERNPEDLTIDVAILGDADSAPSMLIHQSGTHGVEGYTGSAIQIEYLRSAPPPPPGVAIVFVHGVNAHGMAEGRRWNERGVDLNRNYVGPRQGAVVDGTSDPVSFENLAKDPFDLYNKASELVNPVGILAIGGCCGAIEFYPKAASMIAKHGYSALKQAIAGGQYTRWSQALVEKKQQPGLFFGGLQHEQSTALVHGLVTRLGRQRTTALARAAHVDVHTALGPHGHDSLLVLDPTGQPGHVVDLGSTCAALGGDGTAEGLERIRGAGFHVEVMRDSKQGGTAYTVYGAMFESVLIVLSQTTAGGIGKAAAVVQEFGTVPPLQTLQALRAEGAMLRELESQSLPAPPAEHPIRRAVRDCFYPESSSAWKAKVLGRGRSILEHKLAWLGAA